jgi:hypothetical protein
MLDLQLLDFGVQRTSGHNHRSIVFLYGRGFNNFSILIPESAWQRTWQFLPRAGSGLASQSCGPERRLKHSHQRIQLMVY